MRFPQRDGRARSPDRSSVSVMPYFAAGGSGPLARAQAFVRRVYPMRILGTALLVLPYASLFAERGAGAWIWVLMGLNVLGWPHLAFWLARRAPDPSVAEHRNLVLDVAFGGFWIAASGLCIFPAAAMLSILIADRLAAGGWRLLGRAMLLGVVVFLGCWGVLGWPLQPQASTRTMLLALPPVLVYMLALSHVGYQLARRIVQQKRELDRLALTDVVVNLPNRRFFNARAEDLIASARAGGGEAVLLLVDVDCFKAINDRYGHGAGDQALRAIARVLREHAGTGGFPARVGGDEFALLLPATLPQGEALAARLHEAVAALAVPGCDGLTLQISVGVALLAEHHRGLDDWLGAADRAMYVAKAAGSVLRHARPGVTTVDAR